MTIADLHAAIIECQDSTLFFTRYFFKKQFNRKYVIGEHHRLISEALDKVIRGEIKRLIINIAPRYGKTELAVKSFIAKGLSHNPAARFIHLSYSDDLALDNSEAVKDLVKSEDYKLLFPKVEIKKGSDSKKKWYTTAGGGVYATAAGGQVTGFGAGKVDEEDTDFIKEGAENFNGALIIDDPIKPEDADSDLIRDRINERFDSTIKNRVNSRNTPIIIIMQRVHENDLCGHLIERNPEEWTVLSLPCIKEDGTALWEFKHTLEELKQMEKDNPLVFGRQYMQNPQPLKGLLFPPLEIKYYIPSELIAASFESSMGYCDTADEGSDHLAAIVGRNIKELTYIPEVVFSKANTDVTLPLVADMIKRQGVEYMRCESNSFGAMFGRELGKLAPNTQILPIHNSTNKHTRILMQSAHILKYFRFVHPDYQTDQYKAFMKELCKYMKEVKTQAKDDAPDASSGLALFIRSFLSHLYDVNI
jgi:predicted phage terminase large subunit-like protein